MSDYTRRLRLVQVGREPAPEIDAISSAPSQISGAERDVREVFNLAAIAVGMGDKDAALDVCKKLARIEPHYRLALRTEQLDDSSNATHRVSGQNNKPNGPRFISSQYAGRCRTCGTAHNVGDAVLFTPGVRGVECRRCGDSSNV